MPGSIWLGLDAEHAAGGGGVHILAPAEDLLQDILARDMGEQAQLDLGVVGRDELVSFLGDEAGPDLTPQLGANGDVLEVRVVGGQPAGGGCRLVEGGVQPAARESTSSGSASR